MKDYGVIKDYIYSPSQQELKIRKTVRALLIKDHQGILEIGLLHVLTTDVFGTRDHLETPGGAIEPGETAEQAIIREILEETGYHVFHLVPIGTIKTEYQLLERCDEAIFYIAYVDKKIINSNEKHELKWYPINSILKTYQEYDVQNVGILIHKRDLLMIKEMSLYPLIRHGQISDIPQIMTIIDDAKLKLKQSGSPQWQKGYPNQSTIFNDIQNLQLYVLTVNNQVLSTMTVMDYEPTYDKVYEGSWIKGGDYLVIHRIATHKDYLQQGYAKILLQFVKSLAKTLNKTSVRIDTHQLNIEMQKLLMKSGYQYCGIIYLNQDDDKERHAYQLII